jgi:copper chaperone CopZ
MKLILCLASALLLSIQAIAGDVATFQGQITGVVCGACKDHVVSSLAKLKGIKDIEISPTNLPDIRMLTLKVETAALTAEDVNKRLTADHGENYKVTTWVKKS